MNIFKWFFLIVYLITAISGIAILFIEMGNIIFGYKPDNEIIIIGLCFLILANQTKVKIE